jgi:hypothetical protein
MGIRRAPGSSVPTTRISYGSALLVSHPSAKYAEEWGTPRPGDAGEIKPCEAWATRLWTLVIVPNAGSERRKKRRNPCFIANRLRSLVRRPQRPVVS